MNKIQKVKFATINEFLSFLPEEELIIVEELRAFILKSIPCKEKLAYNVPFFYGRKRICFIWPS